MWLVLSAPEKRVRGFERSTKKGFRVDLNAKDPWDIYQGKLKNLDAKTLKREELITGNYFQIKYPGKEEENTIFRQTMLLSH